MNKPFPEVAKAKSKDEAEKPAEKSVDSTDTSVSTKDSTIKNTGADGQKPANYEIQIIGDKNKMNVVTALTKADLFYKISVRDKKFYVQFGTPEELATAKDIANKVVNDGEDMKDAKTNAEQAVDEPVEDKAEVKESFRRKFK